VNSLENLLQRHAAFWNREPVEAPLMRILPNRRREPLENMDITPDVLDVNALTPDVGERDLRKRLVQGDLFHVECPFSRVPWMEAIVGCAIRAGADEAMWPRPALGPNYEGLERIVPQDDNPWLVKLLELTRALVEANDGSYLVTHTLQRGPSDMLSALLGDERMGLAYYDAPDQVSQVLAAAAEAFVRVAKAQYALIPAFHGGWAPWIYGLWAPGTVVRFQSDSSSQLSPRMYREHVLPHDRFIMRSFDYSIIDLHSAGTLHIYPVLLEEEHLNAMSVTLDRYENAPSVADLMPTFAAILEAKSLVIFGEATADEVTLMREKLPARGLCIAVTLTDTRHYRVG
jgi:hypothetical protein